MARVLSKQAEIERSIITTYRKEIWSPFVLAVKKYRLIESGDDPEEIVEREGLAQITDKATLSAYLESVIKENPRSVADYKSGRDFALKFIIGKAMAASCGKADPVLLQEIAKELLS